MVIKKSSLLSSDRLNLVTKAVDCNMVFDRPAWNQFEFASPQDVVRDRKRLGIHRGFIGSQAAETICTYSSNEEIETYCRSKAGVGLIFPAFTIHSSELFAKESSEKLAGVISRNPAAIFKLTCSKREDYFQLGLKFLCRAVSDRKTVVFIRVEELPSIAELVQAAKQHKNIAFVLTDHSWSSQSIVHAAMSEAENILTDTTLIHTAQGIELFVERYGSKRILFGLGYRALGGASLGAVLSAAISREEKEDVLFANIEKILDLPSFNPGVSSSVSDGDWSFYLREGKTSFPMIDAHAHFGPCALWPIRSQDLDTQMKEKSDAMEQQNLRYFIVSGMEAIMGDPLRGNALIEKKFLEMNDSRFLAYFVYNPRFAAELAPHFEKVSRSKTFIGFKLLCDYWRIKVTDKRFEPMWQIADRFELPVLIHTWEGPYSMPGMLDDIAVRYPNARLLMAHCGGSDSGRVEAEAMAQKHPNAFIEWCGSFFSRKPWEQTVREVGAHKIIFGTDAMVHGHDWELARLMSVPLETTEFRQILHDNMDRIISPLLKKRDLTRIFT